MDTTTVLIIGSGFGGQVTAINLLRRGITDFRILERRDFMGGTWCQNSYPGAAVDVPSPLYSIASEPYPWTRMYAEQAELRAYTEHVIDRHRLRERTVLRAEVVSADWDGEGWSVTTSDGDVHRGRFLVNASGPLSTPVVPPFAGLDDFAGHAFHTNGWDHDVDLTGKRVAVIGSGASAAQVIPAIQPAVEELHVFQRSPHWVLPRPDRVFSRLQRRALRLRPLQRGLRTAIYWKLETRVIGFKHSRWLLKRIAQREAVGHIAAQVPDPELRAQAHPRLHDRVQADHPVRHPLSRAGCAQRDPPRPSRRHRPLRRHRHRHRERGAPRPRRRRLLHRLRRHRRRDRVRRARARRRGARRRLGTSSPAPTWARPCPASPTSSSSPAPTPASVTPARSS